MRSKSSELKKRIARICIAVALIFVGCFASEDTGCDCQPEEPPGEDCDQYGCCRPEVDAGEDQEATIGQVVVLRGFVKLPSEEREICISEKDSLRFQWEQTEGPDALLQDPEQRDAFFIAKEEGEYMFRFQATRPLTEVNNRKPKTSKWDTVAVLVSPAVCGFPTAEAGDDQTLSTALGLPVTIALDGQMSHPTNQFGCEHLRIASFLWSVESQPAGANVEVINATQANASADLDVSGTYEFRLEVQDGGGTVGRTNIDTDIVRITLLQSPVCEAGLVVTVVDAREVAPMQGTHVTVVDIDGISHTADTDVAGVASFDSLAPGSRQYITVVSDETVTALPGADDTERPRFETTTVLDHCSSEITIPLRLTASGKSAFPKGTVTAKVPRSIFNMLPHSWKCAWECTDDTECDDSYYCELEGPRCKNLCTPRSLLPFFSLGDHNISGQIRFAWLVPTFSLENPTGPSMDRLFTTMVECGLSFPCNLTTDDTFLNGLAPSLGRNLWGEECINPSDCPDDDDYYCDQDPQGDFRCRDRNPLRNFRMEVPAGQSVRFFLVTGIIDVDLLQLLPTLMPFLIAEYSFAFDIIDFLESYEAKTLHVCPFTVDVISGQENDIKQTLAAITEDDCWSVEYTQKDSVVALKDPYKSIESCESDADCCDPWDRCGFPDSQRKCLYDPDDSSRKGCFTPLFRVSVFTEDQVTVVPPGSGFNPTADRSDERLCSLLPEFAPYEELCDDNPYGVYEPCDPPRYHDLEVPNDAECSFIYGLTLMALDFPEGNAALPEGGRAIIGFDFHGTPDHTRVPKFQIPSLQTNALEGSSIAGFQSYFRDAKPIPDGRYQAIPGHLFAKASLGSIPDELQMPSFLSMPSQSSVIDAGLEVTVVFIPEDPTIWPDPTLEQAYSVAEAMSVPVWSVHELPGVPTVSTHPESEMIGMVLSRVDRVDVQFDHDYWAWNGELIMEDPLWRIYAPAGTTSISLPPEFNPFRIRNEVWVTPWAGSFSTPFEYDLFLPGQILGQMSSYAQDSYAVVAP